MAHPRENADRGAADLVDTKVRESLVSLGAPLAGWRPIAHFSPEETLLGALDLARRDATILRVLPLVVAKNADRFDWSRFERDSNAGRKRSLGLAVELAATLSGQAGLAARARSLFEARSGEPEFFFEPRNEYDRKLAELQTPAVARKWGFLMNMGEDSFRSVFERHLE